MKSHFKWINQKYYLDNAVKIVLGGSSAGGFGTALWIDYLKGLVKEPSKVYGIVDSGILMDPQLSGQLERGIKSLSPLFVPPLSQQEIVNFKAAISASLMTRISQMLSK